MYESIKITTKINKDGTVIYSIDDLLKSYPYDEKNDKSSEIPMFIIEDIMNDNYSD